MDWSQCVLRKTVCFDGKRDSPKDTAPGVTLLHSLAMLRALILLIACFASLTSAAQTLRESLFDAIKAGDYAETARLVKAGVHYTARNAEGDTPLIVAAENARADLVGMWITSGADVAARSTNGEIALHSAALHSDPEIARILLEKSSPVDVVNRDGESPLYWAALSGSIEIVKLLVDHGAQISRVDIKGNSPLHAAAADGHIEVIGFLLERKANRNLRNKAGERPADIAKARGEDAAAAVLNRPPESVTPGRGKAT